MRCASSHEHHSERHRTAHGDESTHVGDAPVVALDHAQDEAGDCAHQHDGTDEIGNGPIAARRCGAQGPSQHDEHDDPDGQIGCERPPPADRFDQRAADRRSGRSRNSSQPAGEAHGGRSPGWPESIEHQGEHCRTLDRDTTRLYDPGGDEGLDARCRCHESRPGHEDGKTANTRARP